MAKAKKILSLMLVLLTVFVSIPSFAANENNTTVLYNARITTLFNETGAKVYVKADKDSKALAHLNSRTPIKIVEVLPNYVGILYNGKVAYVLRHRIENPVPVDEKTIPPFGTVVSNYYAIMDKDTPVHSEPNSNSEVLITLHQGAIISFMDLENGWAKLIFKRQYGYVDTRLISELLPVAQDINEADENTPLAVYNSFYNIAETELNQNRMENLRVCAMRSNRVMQPGDVFDFNNTVGPFRPANGYKEAGALLDGKWTTAYGGGSCQSSSTLYNVVLQLTGMTVLRRSPHGANGATYLPHGVDASSGKLNFEFRNDYSFPITITSHVQDGSIFYAIYKGALQ